MAAPIIDHRRQITADLIQEVTEKIVRAFNPKRVILFGSQARGGAHEDSDLDLMVEMESDKSAFARAVEVSQLFGLRCWPLDVVVYTPEEVREQRDNVGTFVNLIEREGKVLYEQQ